jgi:hypothetical protein
MESSVSPETLFGLALIGIGLATLVLALLLAERRGERD